ncbi:glycosyltransferase [Zhihengliuella flava]|uniref:D-inositol 3-phosphate glycosyltransferase n=1 Tax=Zhihengliuella flava TaxID=1285193 RepID=A0A931GES1_9MICC|nr:glycosyltransferase [Zhihengliuella flava]MBG6083867.1 glycosyltransferase involved in cell wall biosynthesis [Zhihengliuella flava]
MAQSERDALHIVIFVDQHPATLGGMQTSVLLQQRFLERNGHRVTIVAPARRRATRPLNTEASIVSLPSVPLGSGEYSLAIPGPRSDARIDAELASRPAVDVVHVQADFWGAAIGYRYAQRHGLPVVHTMHNRVDVGLAATMPFPKVMVRAMAVAQRRLLRLQGTTPRDAWTYLRAFTDAAAAVTAPSTHFAQLLEARQVFDHVEVIPTGLDDDAAASLRGVAKASDRAGERLRLVWTGRFSPEKRLLPFLRAVVDSGADVDVHLFGDGGQRSKAEAFLARTARSGRGPRFTFRGKVPYEQMLAELAAADVLVQTSIGFETQGMTVFEAVALGTPVVLSDHRIAADLPTESYWLTHDDAEAALAEAIQVAVAQTRAGLRWSAREAEALLQSRQSTKMIELYRRVTRAEAGPTAEYQ